MTTHEQIVEAFAAVGLTATWEHPGVIMVADRGGRHLEIGRANGPWGVDVYRTAQDRMDGRGPDASMDIEDENDAALLVQQFLYIASEFVKGGR